MDKCFVVCGCDDLEGVTKSDLDRYTDKIENVLNDVKGRRLFRNFMHTITSEDGRHALELWENIDILLNDSDAECTSSRSYLEKYDRLTEAAESIEELDFAIMERLIIARDSENKDEMKNVLKALKVQTANALRREYNKFREQFIPKKNN